MSKKTFVCLVFLLLSVGAKAQTPVRYDNFSFVTNQVQAVGIFTTVLSPSSQAQVTVCAHPANGVPCTNTVQTYTDITGTTKCPLTSQLTPYNASACTGTADLKGNFGFWIPPGTYDYTVCPQGQFACLGPYPISVSPVTSSGGGSGGFGTQVPSGSTIQSTISTVSTSGAGAPVVIPQGFTGSGNFTNSTFLPILNYTPSPNGDYDKNGVQPVDIFGVRHDGQHASCHFISGNAQVTCQNLITPFTSADVGKLFLGYAIGGLGAANGGVVYNGSVASGGSGGTNGTQSLVTTNGGCQYPMRGWVTVSSGVPSGAITIWQPGYGCSSPPTTATVATVTGTVTLTGVTFVNADLPTTIASVQNGTTITLADAPSLTLFEDAFYGTDDAVALENACNGRGLAQNGGHFTHVGLSLISRGPVCDGNNTWIQGAGWTPLTNLGGGSNILYAGKNLSGTDAIWITSQGWGAKLTDMGFRGNSFARPRGLEIAEGTTARGNGNSAIGLFDHLWIGWMYGDNVAGALGAYPSQISKGIWANVTTGNGDFNNFGQIYVNGALQGIDGNNDQATSWQFRQLQIEHSYVGICAFNGTFIDMYFTEFNSLDINLGPCETGTAGFPVLLDIKLYGGETSAQNIKYGTNNGNNPTLIIHSAGFGQPPEYEDPSNIMIDLSSVINSGLIELGDGVSGGFQMGGPFGNSGGERTAMVSMPAIYGGTYEPTVIINGLVPGQISTPAFGADNCGVVCGNRVGTTFTLNGNKVNLDPVDYQAVPVPWQQNDFLGTVRDFGSLIIKSPRPLGETDSGSGIFGVTLSTVGTAGSTTYNYQITCSDQSGNETPATALSLGGTPNTFSISTGNATLSTTNYINIATLWQMRGCAYYNFYGNEGSGGLGYLTTVASNLFSGTFSDQGQYTKNTGRLPPAVTKSGSLTVEGPSTLSKINGTVYVDGIAFATVQAAINALPSSGGTVVIPCGSYIGPTSIPSGTHLVSTCPLPSALEGILDSATALKLTKFTYSANQTFSNVRDIAIDGITFDFGGNGGLILDGIGWSHFDMAVVNCASTGPCLSLLATTTNLSANEFTRLYTYGGSESVLMSGNSGGTNFVADNHFGTMFLGSPNNGSNSGTYIDFARWCDSNVFDFVNFFNVNQGVSNTITGVIFNSNTPGSNVGVYNEVFHHIDFDSGTLSGLASSNFFVVNYSFGDVAEVGYAAPLVDGNNSPKTSVNAACTLAAGCTFTLVSGSPNDTFAGFRITNGQISTGTNIVYRCATAGTTLPAGSLTITAAACGTTTDTGLRVR